MYATNDYLAGLLSANRQHELQAEAAEHRLGKLAQPVRTGRPSWWQRVSHGTARHGAARLTGGLKPHHSH